MLSNYQACLIFSSFFVCKQAVQLQSVKFVCFVKISLFYQFSFTPTRYWFAVSPSCLSA